MPDDAVSLRAEYRPLDPSGSGHGGQMDGEAPVGWTVTARGGALVAHCPTWAQALTYLTRWAKGDV